MDDKKKISSKIIAIIVYSLIAISIRYLIAIYKPSFLAPIADGLLYSILTGIGPLIAAIVVVVFFHRKMEYSNYGISKLKSIISALIPIISFLLYDIWVKNYSYSNTLIVITCLIYSYCEEYGWRGYLQSELLNMTTLRRITIITIIWFIWHLNFTISQSNAIFLLILFFASWGIGQITIRSKSIITCGCFHAIVNIVYNIQMDKIKILILTACVICWFLIWYNKWNKLLMKFNWVHGTKYGINDLNK